MQLGIEALNKNRYESARKSFAKVLRKAPNNSDIVYFLGVTELGLQHRDVARENFQRALALDPDNELALVSLGQMQLQGGAPADAVIPLEKAVSLGRAGWRADFELASAYFQLHRLRDAETAATRAVSLAKEKGATSLYLLGEIQYAEGKRTDAKHTLETVLKAFPKDSAVFTTRKMLERIESEGLESASLPPDASLPPPPAPDTNPVTLVEIPWAPRNTDDAVYDVASLPSLGRKLLRDAHASSSVPSTVKWSSDSSFLRLASESTAPRNPLATWCSSSLSLFLEKTEASNAGAMMFISINHLNNRSY